MLEGYEGDEAMSLCDIQARLRDISPGYVSMFSWKLVGNIVKAVPHRPGKVSIQLDKTMIKLGFTRVWHDGEWWFQLLLAEEIPKQPKSRTVPLHLHTETSYNCGHLFGLRENTLNHATEQLNHLVKSGEQWLKENPRK